MIERLFFPDSASDIERAINWQKITEIKDADFGFNTPKERTNITRFSVRILLFNEKQDICVIYTEKYSYMQLPGGGIEKDESILDGLKRETREELPDKEVGTNYMDDEIAEGFKPIWINLSDFISEQESHEGKIGNYSGCFATRRDLEIAKYYYKISIKQN